MSVQPDFERFVACSREHRIVPVWRSLLADQVTPVAVFARCVGQNDGFLLESVDNGERWLCCVGIGLGIREQAKAAFDIHVSSGQQAQTQNPPGSSDLYRKNPPDQPSCQNAKHHHVQAHGQGQHF